MIWRNTPPHPLQTRWLIPSTSLEKHSFEFKPLSRRWDWCPFWAHGLFCADAIDDLNFDDSDDEPDEAPSSPVESPEKTEDAEVPAQASAISTSGVSPSQSSHDVPQPDSAREYYFVACGLTGDAVAHELVEKRAPDDFMHEKINRIFQSHGCARFFPTARSAHTHGGRS